MCGEGLQVKLPCLPGKHHSPVQFALIGILLGCTFIYTPWVQNPLTHEFPFSGGHPHKQNPLADSPLQPPDSQGMSIG